MAEELQNGVRAGFWGWTARPSSTEGKPGNDEELRARLRHHAGGRRRFGYRRLAMLRDECLNEHVFGTLAEARRIIRAWRLDDNTVRPHTSLAGLTPAEFAAKAGALPTQRVGGTAPCGGSMPPARCSPAPQGAEQQQT